MRIVGVNPEVWAARRLRLTLDCWVGTKTYWGDSIVNQFKAFAARWRLRRALKVYKVS